MKASQPLVQLNDYLTRYVRVHDYVFNQRPLQKVDHAELLAELENVGNSLEDLSDELAHYLDSSDYKLAANYTTALLNAIRQLTTIVSGLRRKAEHTGKYGFFEYRSDLKKYRELVATYKAHGENLNSVAAKLSPSPGGIQG